MADTTEMRIVRRIDGVAYSQLQEHLELLESQGVDSIRLTIATNAGHNTPTLQIIRLLEAWSSLQLHTHIGGAVGLHGLLLLAMGNKRTVAPDSTIALAELEWLYDSPQTRLPYSTLKHAIERLDGNIEQLAEIIARMPGTERFRDRAESIFKGELEPVRIDASEVVASGLASEITVLATSRGEIRIE